MLTALSHPRSGRVAALERRWPAGSKSLRTGLLTACVLGGCVDPHWAAASWPAQSDRVAQPHARADAAGVELEARAMTWEPEAVTVELDLINIGETALVVDASAILLAWDGLEFPAKGERPTLTIDPSASVAISLRYQLGRPLESPGARLVLRALAREGVSLVVVPSLELPPAP